MSDSDMTSNKPYVIRALYEWICDNELTPYIMVASDYPGAELPLQFAQDGRIILNLAPSAISNYFCDNDAISFSARFSGLAQNIYVPVEAIMGIYAKENGKGMFYEITMPEPADDVQSPLADVSAVKSKNEAEIKEPSAPQAVKSDEADKKQGKDDKPKATKVSHLKVIK